MLRTLPDLPPGVIGFEAIGEVHSDDYRDVLRPAIEAAADAGPVHLVYVLGPEFTGYSAGATWQDTTLGLGHLGAFERTAVVTDQGWVEHLVSGFGWMVPGELRRFALDERDDAVRWAAGIEPEPEPVPEPAAVAPEPEPEPEPEAQTAAEQPTAAEPVTEESPVPVQPQVPLGAQQTLTPHAPFSPGADLRPGMATPAPTPPVVPAVPEQWAADPTGRHQHRWWNGREWTEHVADNGVSAVDPIL